MTSIVEDMDVASHVSTCARCEQVHGLVMKQQKKMLDMIQLLFRKIEQLEQQTVEGHL